MRVGSRRNNYGNLPLFLFPVSFCFNSRPLFSSVSTSPPWCLLDTDCKLYMEIYVNYYARTSYVICLLVDIVYLFACGEYTIVFVYGKLLYYLASCSSDLVKVTRWLRMLVHFLEIYHSNSLHTAYNVQEYGTIFKAELFLWYNTLCSTIYLMVNYI